MMCTYKGIDPVKTGKRLRELMHMKDVTVSEITRQLSVSNQTVYKWLNGQSLPSLENMYQLSRLLQIGMDEIIVAFDAVEYETPEIYIREEWFQYQVRQGEEDQNDYK